MASRAPIERCFRAMQRGADAEHELVALFAEEDAVDVERFSGAVHQARAAIREWLTGSRAGARGWTARSLRTRA